MDNTALTDENDVMDLHHLAWRVTDHIDAMLAYWDKDSVCRFANSAYLQWFGKTKEEMIGKLTIRNRVLSTAHAEVYATDGGMTTERYVQYYEEKAKGGIGLAICGGSSVVAIDSPQEWWSSVNLSTDRIIPHFQNLADAMHKHGAKIMIQATHMGRRNAWHGFDWPHLVSPSGVREPVHRGNAKTIKRYRLTSANDAPERDPYNWTLEGSQNNTDFTVLDTRTAVAFGNRKEQRAGVTVSATTIDASSARA